MKILFYILFFVSVTFFSCQINPEKENFFEQANDKSTLLTAISADPSLSMFYDSLKKYRYTNLLASDNSLTIIAPTNEAIKAYTGPTDSITIKKIIEFHIIYSFIRLSEVKDKDKFETFGKKILLFSLIDNVLTINNMTIDKTGSVLKNGALYIMNELYVPLPNILEVIMSNPKYSVLAAFIYQRKPMNTLFQSRQDSKNGEIVQDSIGNSYIQDTRIADENYTTTYFIVNDSIYIEWAKNVATYFNHQSIDKDNKLVDSTQLFMKRDGIFNKMAFDGMFRLGKMPSHLVSLDGSIFNIKKTTLGKEILCSNGIIYDLSSYQYTDSSKFFKSKLIEGETAQAYTKIANEKLTSIYYSKASNDKFIELESKANKDSFYLVAKDLPTCNYTVSYRCFNYTNTISDFSMYTKYYLSDEKESITLETLANFDPKFEKTIGQFAVTKYGNQVFKFKITGGSNTAPKYILLDYIRLVPIAN